MAKLIGPLMSIAASGSIAGTLTFASTKGRAYVRQLVKPSNPRTAGQTSNRAMMRFLGQEWAALTAPEQATWQARADVTKISPFNAFVSANMNRWTQYQAPSQQDPATDAPTTIAINTWTATGGVRQITLAADFADTAGDAIWGIWIHRGLVTGFVPSKSNVIAVINQIGITNPVIYIDTPLEPDTYFYRATGFAVGGGQDVVAGEVTAVAS